MSDRRKTHKFRASGWIKVMGVDKNFVFKTADIQVPPSLRDAFYDVMEGDPGESAQVIARLLAGVEKSLGRAVAIQKMEIVRTWPRSASS
jgi:hypothetical protein